MDFDFYLSEMSVSDLHGGGLTLQRVIGTDLDHITYFIHTNRIAYDLPATEKYKARDINLASFWDGNFARSVLGNTLARSISRAALNQKLAAKSNAALLNKKFDKSRQLTGLICPQGAGSVYTLEALKNYRKIKYITWIMDDHVVKYEQGNWHYHEGYEPVFKKHLYEAEQVFVISPAMQEFYLDRFGVESEVLFGPADMPLYGAKSDLNESKPVRIGYFGAVAAWQLDALRCFAKALPGTGVQLDIYSGVEKLQDGLNLPGVNFKGRIAPEQVLSAMQKYNAVLLPISFTEKMRHMSQFNIATKMSEYLASGVPIFVVGPEYAAMVKYLKMHNAAIIADSCNEEDIKLALNRLTDKNHLSKILENARLSALNETGSKAMQLRWAKGVEKLLS